MRSLYATELPHGWAPSAMKLQGVHVLNGFFLYSILLDYAERQQVLILEHNINQRDRLKIVLDQRNQRMKGTGQEEYTHACKACFFVMENENGQKSMSMFNLSIHISNCLSIQPKFILPCVMVLRLDIRAVVFTTVKILSKIIGHCTAKVTNQNVMNALFETANTLPSPTSTPATYPNIVNLKTITTTARRQSLLYVQDCKTPNLSAQWIMP